MIGEMMTMRNIYDAEIYINYPEDMTEEEAFQYVDYLESKYKAQVAAVYIDYDDDDYINLEFELIELPFERIRRITGYLVGTTDRWNDAKQSELKDRVMHNVVPTDI